MLVEGVFMAKVKSKRGRAGYVFFKERGGAPDRKTLEQDRPGAHRGQPGSAAGFSTLAAGSGSTPISRGGCVRSVLPAPWAEPTEVYDTIIVDHVANVLTRASRAELLRTVNALLAAGGVAFISVARNIPVSGKPGPRRRIQNYVVLTLPSVFADNTEEIYRLAKDAVFEDCTREFEETI